MAAAPSCTWVDCPAVWGWTMILHFGEAVLMMELPKRHSAPPEGGRFAPIKSSGYGGRPLTGPRPDDLLELRLVEWSGWVNE